MITWDRLGAKIICVLSWWQVIWIRDAVAEYCDQARDAEGKAPKNVRDLMDGLLADLPLTGGVVVFRHWGHRFAWACVLEELRAMREGLTEEHVASWLVNVIEFLLAAGDEDSTVPIGP